MCFHLQKSMRQWKLIQIEGWHPIIAKAHSVVYYVNNYGLILRFWPQNDDLLIWSIWIVTILNFIHCGL